MKKESLDFIYPEKLVLHVERYEHINENKIMKSWKDTQDGMPNIFNRTSIFSSEKSKDDVMYNQKEIVSYIKGCEIKYTGPSLDKKDYQIFQLCLHTAKENSIPLGETFRIYPAEWLKILKRSDNTRSRNELYKCLKKLTSANVNIIRKVKLSHGDIIEDISGSLLSGFKKISFTKEEEGLTRSDKKIDLKWLISINPNIKELFLNDLTLIDLRKSAEIKTCLGLWLHDFYSSHHNPIPISTTKLKEISGASSTISHFNQALELNLEKLVEIGFLNNFSFENKSRSEKILFVEKAYKSPISVFQKREKTDSIGSHINQLML